MKEEEIEVKYGNGKSYFSEITNTFSITTLARYKLLEYFGWVTHLTKDGESSKEKIIEEYHSYIKNLTNYWNKSKIIWVDIELSKLTVLEFNKSSNIRLDDGKTILRYLNEKTNILGQTMMYVDTNLYLIYNYCPNIVTNPYIVVKHKGLLRINLERFSSLTDCYENQKYIPCNIPYNLILQINNLGNNSLFTNVDNITKQLILPDETNNNCTKIDESNEQIKTNLSELNEQTDTINLGELNNDSINLANLGELNKPTKIKEYKPDINREIITNKIEMMKELRKEIFVQNNYFGSRYKFDPMFIINPELINYLTKDKMIIKWFGNLICKKDNIGPLIVITHYIDDAKIFFEWIKKYIISDLTILISNQNQYNKIPMMNNIVYITSKIHNNIKYLTITNVNKLNIGGNPKTYFHYIVFEWINSGYSRLLSIFEFYCFIAEEPGIIILIDDLYQRYLNSSYCLHITKMTRIEFIDFVNELGINSGVVVDCINAGLWIKDYANKFTLK